MKKPTILYRFDSLEHGPKKIIKHKVTKECCPQIEIEWSGGPEYAGHLWRCQCESGDHYGYASREEAVIEERRNAAQRIAADQLWLKSLL